MSSPRPPTGTAQTVRFHEARSHSGWLMVDRAFADAVASLGLDAAIGAPRLLDDEGEVAGNGRGPTRVIALPGRRERLHWRRILHGGVLAPLWMGGLAGIGRVREELWVGAALHRRGAPVARPVLAVGLREGALWRAGVATVHLEDAVDGVTFLASRPDRERVVRAARAAGRAVGRFHALGGQHRELHLGNLLLRERGDDVEAWLIDLDGCRAGAPPDAARRRRELRRLARSVRKRGLDHALGEDGAAVFVAGYAEACRGEAG